MPPHTRRGDKESIIGHFLFVMKTANFVGRCLVIVSLLGFSQQQHTVVLPTWLLNLHHKPGLSLFTIPHLADAASLVVDDAAVSEYDLAFSYSGRTAGQDFIGTQTFNLTLSSEGQVELEKRMHEICMSYVPVANCEKKLMTFIVDELEQGIWLQRNILRQHKYTFDPPFFASSGNFKTFKKHLLDYYDGPRRPLLDLDQPLLLLEVGSFEGSFEGSSAAWLAESLLVHPSSLLICVDAWTTMWTSLDEENNNSEIDDMQNILGEGTAINNFVNNMARTPGGGQVVGLRADNSMVALTALIYSQSPPLCTDDCNIGIEGLGYKESSHKSRVATPPPPPPSPLFLFDFIYIDAGHSASDVLTDGILSFHLLKVGGVIVFDDYEYAEDTKFAVDAFVRAFDKELRIIFKGYIIIAAKIDPV